MRIMTKKDRRIINIKCSVLDAHEITKIEARLCVTNDQRAEKLMKDLFFLDEEGLDMDDIKDGERDRLWTILRKFG